MTTEEIISTSLVALAVAGLFCPSKKDKDNRRQNPSFSKWEDDEVRGAAIASFDEVTAAVKKKSWHDWRWALFVGERKVLCGASVSLSAAKKAAERGVSSIRAGEVRIGIN